VQAGARRDLGQDEESRRILQSAIESFTASGEQARLPKARLRYAYADALATQGKEAEARSWFVAAAKLDHEAETDAQARVDAIDGLSIEFDESDDDEDVDLDLPVLEGKPPTERQATDEG
jgi:hypothetical protein